MGLRLEGQTTGHVTLQAPATAADNTLTLPNGNGSNGDTLITNGSGCCRSRLLLSVVSRLHLVQRCSINQCGCFRA